MLVLLVITTQQRGDQLLDSEALNLSCIWIGRKKGRFRQRHIRQGVIYYDIRNLSR